MKNDETKRRFAELLATKNRGQGRGGPARRGKTPPPSTAVTSKPASGARANAPRHGSGHR